jgi:hypothetical protein
MAGEARPKNKSIATMAVIRGPPKEQKHRDDGGHSWPAQTNQKRRADLCSRVQRMSFGISSRTHSRYF